MTIICHFYNSCFQYIMESANTIKNITVSQIKHSLAATIYKLTSFKFEDPLTDQNGLDKKMNEIISEIDSELRTLAE